MSHETILEFREWVRNTQYSKENVSLLRTKLSEIEVLLSISPSYSDGLKLIQTDINSWKKHFDVMERDDWVAPSAPDVNPKTMYDSCRKELMLTLNLIINRVL